MEPLAGVCESLAFGSSRVSLSYFAAKSLLDFAAASAKSIENCAPSLLKLSRQKANADSPLAATKFLQVT